MGFDNSDMEIDNLEIKNDNLEIDLRKIIYNKNFEELKNLKYINFDINLPMKQFSDKQTPLLMFADINTPNYYLNDIFLACPNLNIFDKESNNASMFTDLTYPENEIKQLYTAEENCKNFKKYFFDENMFRILLEFPNIDVNIEFYSSHRKILDGKKYNNILFHSIRNDHFSSFLLLINHPNINVNIQDKKGRTALMLTIIRENKKYVDRDILFLCFNELLNHPSIDLNIKDNNGRTFFDYIMMSEYKDKYLEVLQDEFSVEDLDGIMNNLNVN